MGERARGEILGRYRLLAVLGRGAWGVTYEAEAADGTAGGPRVALKELRLSGLDDWKFLELFEREGRVLSQVTHPAVPAYVEQFTVDAAGERSFCIVQQIAPGRSLESLVASGWRADETEARRIAEILLDVLDYLHARRPPVFHRDIKPSNVLRDDTGKLALVDFGSVRDVYRSTVAGGSTVAGTFGYMAPEQLHGVARPESDLHGLGATLLFALCGRSPSVLPHHKLRVDFRSSVRVGPAFADWLARLLEPAPEDRFPGAREALRALHAPAAPTPRPSGLRLTTVALLMTLMGLLATLVGVGVYELRQRVLGSKLLAPTSLPPLPGRPSVWHAPVLSFERRLDGHVGPVKSVAFSPDGTQLLSGGFDGIVKLWDARSGASIRSLPGHLGRVAEVLFTPDGRQAITGADRAVRIWALPAGNLLRTIDVPTSQVFDVAVDPSGQKLAVTGDGGRAWLYALDGTVLQTLAHGGPRVLAAAFSADGGNVVTAGDDATVKVWNVADGKLSCTLTGHRAAVGGVAVAPDGQLVASASDDHSVILWHLHECRAIQTLSLHSDEAWSVHFSPDGALLLSGGKDTVMGVWAMPGGTLREGVDMGTSNTLDEVFSPDGARVATAERTGVVWIWRVARPGQALPLPEITIKEEAPEGTSEEDVTYFQGLKILDRYHGNGKVLDEAERHYKDMLARWPGSSRAKAGLANIASHRAFRIGDQYDPEGLAAALRLSDEALAADPKFASGLRIRAWILHDMKDDDGARRALDAALRVAPGHPGALALRAKMQKKDRDLAGAERTLVEILSHPLDASRAGSTLEDLAQIDEDRGDMEAADEARRRQVEVVPESAWAKGDYAEFLIRKGDSTGAIVMAQRALAQLSYGAGKNTLAHAYCARGEGLLWMEHKTDEALRAFQAAENAFPSDCADYGLGAYYQFQGVNGKRSTDLLAARTYYEKALAKEPKNGLARAALQALK